MAMMSSSKWSHRPTTRGSSSPSKHVLKPSTKSRPATSMIEPSLACGSFAASSLPTRALPFVVRYSTTARYVQILVRRPWLPHRCYRTFCSRTYIIRQSPRIIQHFRKIEAEALYMG